MVWNSIQLGPSGSPRPDVWTLNKSYTNPRPLAYEVKISKADYQRDVSAGKWQSYLAFSRAVIFAVPLGFVGKADLPKGCELMTWNGETWHTTKAPTLNVVPAFSRELTMKLLIDGVEREAAHQRVESKRAWRATDAFTKKFGANAARAISEEIDFDQRLEQMQKRYREEERKERERCDATRQQIERQAHAAQVEFCRTLGIPDDSSSWNIRSRVRELARDVSRDEEVAALRDQLENIRRALEACKQTPNAVALRLVEASDCLTSAPSALKPLNA